MNIEVNIHDYLSDDDVKDVLRKAIYDEIKESIRYDKSLTTFISNLSYKYVFNMVDEIVKESIGTGIEESIKQKVPEIINDLSSYSIFRAKDNWQTESVGQKLLNEAVIENKDLLKDKVKELLVKEYNKYNAGQDFANLMSDVVYEIFLPKNL